MDSRPITPIATDLSEFTDEELRAELERRNHAVCAACGEKLIAWYFLGHKSWGTEKEYPYKSFCRSHPSYDEYVAQFEEDQANGVHRCFGSIPYPEHVPAT